MKSSKYRACINTGEDLDEKRFVVVDSEISLDQNEQCAQVFSSENEAFGALEHIYHHAAEYMVTKFSQYIIERKLGVAWVPSSEYDSIIQTLEELESV